MKFSNPIEQQDRVGKANERKKIVEQSVDAF